MNKLFGSELSLYVNGKQYSLELTEMQFVTITKILGLSFEVDEGKIACFTDKCLKRSWKAKNNPLRLIRIEKDK